MPGIRFGLGTKRQQFGDTGVPSVFDGGLFRLYSGSSASDAGDVLASGTLPSFAFNGANEADVRTLHGEWIASDNINGTVAGLYLESVDGLSKAFLTVTESGGGGDVIIDDDALRIGDTVVVSTLDWATSEESLYPNRPAGWTNFSELDFSQTPPAGSIGVDLTIAGTDWKCFENADNPDPFNSYWAQLSDASAPQTPPSTWVGTWRVGTYATGHGIGNVFTYGPGNLFLTNPISRVYMSMRVKFEFPDTSYWHPISNKFVNIFGDHSTILTQVREAANWRHAEELGNGDPYFSFFVDNGIDAPGEDHIPEQVLNSVIPINEWVQLEVVIDIPNHIFKVWQNGVLTTSAAPNFASTSMNTIGFYAFRGGGGETLGAVLKYHYDHFFIAW